MGESRPPSAAFAAGLGPAPLTPLSSLPGRCESAYIKAQPPTFRCSWNFLSWSWHRPERHTVLIPRTISPPLLSPPHQACSRSADSRSCVVCLVNNFGCQNTGKSEKRLFFSLPSGFQIRLLKQEGCSLRRIFAALFKTQDRTSPLPEKEN